MMRAALFATLALLCALLCVVLTLTYVDRESGPYIYKTAAEAPTTTVAMVLGASVFRNGDLSGVLAARAERAIELYRAGKVSKILVTGDNSEVSHNEVNPVGNYLVRAGIPKEDIFLDHAGFDTYSSMFRAKHVFMAEHMTVVSQRFHLARAVYIARSLGVDAVGVEAEGNALTYNTVREVPATLKAFFDLKVNRQPKFLGEPFPLTGSGTPTWADGTSTPLQ